VAVVGEMEEVAVVCAYMPEDRRQVDTQGMSKEKKRRHSWALGGMSTENSVVAWEGIGKMDKMEHRTLADIAVDKTANSIAETLEDTCHSRIPGRIPGRLASI